MHRWFSFMVLRLIPMTKLVLSAKPRGSVLETDLFNCEIILAW